MSNKVKRILLFIFGCIFLRSYLVYLAMDINNLSYMILPSIIIGIGFLYIYFTGSRQTGPEVFGEKIWWNDLRPLHGLLWISFAILAIIQNKYAWIILLADVIIGFIAFLLNTNYTLDIVR